MMFGGIIFDFDGVLIESEYVSGVQIAATLTRLGHPTTADDAIDRFTGLSGSDFLSAVSDWIGGPVPDGFHTARAAEDARVMAEGVDAVAGAVDFVLSLPPELPRAIASSSRTPWIRAHLAHVGLAQAFGDHIYSGREHVVRGKPAPDLYLHAAAAIGVDIGAAVIIEDSIVGVTGAVASGATVIGLAVGRHCRDGHGALLVQRGAHHLARSFDEVRALIA